MSLFDGFKGNTAEALAVETKDGGWKEHLFDSERSQHNVGTAVKVMALAGLALSTVFTAPVSFGLAAIFAMAHVTGSVAKAGVESDARTRMVEQNVKDSGGTFEQAVQTAENSVSRASTALRNIIKPV